MKKKRLFIVLSILLMAVGFAAVSTTLYLNGDANIGTNQEDFDVYIDDVQILKTISKDRKTITYETNELKTKGETSILDYEVTNASKQYDAKVEVNCIPKEDEWIHVEAEQTEEIIEARSKGVGKINVTLKQNPLEEMSITFSCTLKVEAIERESIIVDEIAPTEIQTWEFDYTGSEQEFIVPRSGEYKIELWGASGYETDSIKGGSGAYTAGNITLKRDSSLYLYVGETGITTVEDKKNYGVSIKRLFGTPSFNGASGGNYTCYSFHNKTAAYNNYGGSGTDIRLINGAWNSFDSLKSRIMVAGGGASGNRNESGAAAGGLIGYTGNVGTGGSQTKGGEIQAGGFGYAAFPVYNGNSCNNSILTGAGSGYYGGGNGTKTGEHIGMFSGGGGSSFISGHNGCDAIEEVSTEENIIHTGQANHYSGLVFTDTLMIDGNGYKWSNVKEDLEPMPKPDGTFYEEGIGHTGNGYAKITYLGK